MRRVSLLAASLVVVILSPTAALSSSRVREKEFLVPTASSSPHYIVTGPDGNLWFTEFNGEKIGRITTRGVFTEFPVFSNAHPSGIAVGPDGNVWFTEFSGNQIGRITTSGVLTEFPLPTHPVDPYGITAGSDGNLW